MPNDHKPSWTDFFRSLPGKPDTILSDPDHQSDLAEGSSASSVEHLALLVEGPGEVPDGAPLPLD